MEQTIIDAWLAANAQNFPKEMIPVIYENLKNLNKYQIQELLSIDFKDPTVALLLSVLSGGIAADRFYLKQVGFAILKIICVICTFGIWWAVDCFLITKATKKYNAQQISKLFVQ